MRKITTLAATAALGAGLLAGVAPPAAAGPHSPGATAGPKCDPANKVKFTARKRTNKVNERDEVFNRTRDTIQRAAHFEKTSTFTWRVSGGVEGSFKALIFAEVKVHVNAGIDKSATVRAGYTDTVKIRKGYKLTATQGWRTQYAAGFVYHIYSNCGEKVRGYFKFNAPYSTYVSYRTKKL